MWTCSSSLIAPSPCLIWSPPSNTSSAALACRVWIWCRATACIQLSAKPFWKGPCMSAEQRWQLRIEHILEAIRKIKRYTAGLSEETFASQDMAVDAVIRNFQVIGEAARHVPDDVQA